MFFFRSEPLWGPPIKAFLTWQLGNILQRLIFNFPAVFLFSFNFVQLFVTGRNLDWRRTSTSIGWSKALHSHFRVRISANISEGRSIIDFWVYRWKFGIDSVQLAAAVTRDVSTTPSSLLPTLCLQSSSSDHFGRTTPTGKGYFTVSGISSAWNPSLSSLDSLDDLPFEANRKQVP